MKAIGLPVCDPRVSQMNDAQWLWSFFNVQKDEEEEEKTWKTRLTYLGSYTDPIRAREVVERDIMEEGNSNNNIGVPIEGMQRSSEFAIERAAAEMGYDPNSGITAREFLFQLDNKEQDMYGNPASFDDLIKSGQFSVVAESDNNVGNKFESQSDFLSRVSVFENINHDTLNKITTNIPIGIETNEEINSLTQNKRDLINNLFNDDIEEMRRTITKNQNNVKSKNVIDDDDLDIIITHDNE